MISNYETCWPKFYVGEIVQWLNAINPKFVKIVVVYKLETEAGGIMFRYAGLKQTGNKKWEYLEKAMVNFIFDEEELEHLQIGTSTHSPEVECGMKDPKMFESYNPTNASLNIITKPNSNNLFAINFKNTIDPKIKIKSVSESIYSKYTEYVNMISGCRYATRGMSRDSSTTFINLKPNNVRVSTWKEYTDVDTLDKVYVNHIHKITSNENPKTFLTHDIDEHVEPDSAWEDQSKWIQTFRKLIVLLESKQSDHIIAIIKECLFPNIKFCFGDIVYNNSYEGFGNTHAGSFLEERTRTSKSLNFIVNDICMIKDHHKIWKPRYLLISLDADYKLGWCDEERLGEVQQHIETVYEKMKHLSRYKQNDTNPINEVWDDDDSVTYKTRALNKKRKRMKVRVCHVTKTYKQYKSDIYNKRLVCNRVVKAIC